MKKKLIAIVILSVLLLSLTPCACAAGVSSFVTLDSCTAGIRIMLPIAPIAGDEQVIADYLPSGCTLSVRDGVLYLTGIPMYAGEETFSVNTSYGGLLCSMEVNAATPSVSVLDGDVTVMKGTVASISVAASTADAGTLYYQWYTKSGLAIDGACSGVFNIDTDFSGSGSYYCVVTNDNNGRTASAPSELITVTVDEPVVDSVSIDSLPTVTQYSVGDSVNTMGLSIRVKYLNGSSAILYQGFNVTPSVFMTPGRQTVTLEYMGKSCSYQVNVKGSLDNVLGIGVVTLPEKTEYKVGDEPETEGLSIRVYTDKGTQDITGGFEVSPEKFTRSGKQKVTVSFGGKTCSFEVTVEKKTDNAVVTVVSMPDKLDYVKGERLDTAGLVLRLSDDEGSEDVYEGFSCTPKVLTNTGVQQIRVIYGRYSTTFNVNVKENLTGTPAPAATPAATVSPLIMPSALPTVSAPPQTQSRDSSGNALVAVVVIASVLALGALGAYVYIMQRRGQR